MGYVQGASSTFGANTTLAYPSNNTAGNQLVVLVSYPNSESVTLTDTNTNSYTRKFVNTTWSNNNIATAFYLCTSCAGGANTVSPALSGGGYADVCIAEYSARNTVDQSGSQAGYMSSGSPATTPSITTLYANENIIAFCESNNAFGVSGSFTARVAITYVGATYAQIADDIVTSTGTYNASWTTGSGSEGYYAGIISLYTPGGAVVNTNQLMLMGCGT